MATRRVLWGAAALLSVVALVLIGAIGWLLLRPRAQTTGLVVLRTDGQLQVIAGGAAGGATRTLETQTYASGFLFPAVSADGHTLAYVAKDNDAMVLMVQDVARGTKREVFRSMVEQPIDIGFSPDGKYLAWLVSGPNSFVARVAPVDASAQPQLLASGRQTFFAWKPDSSAMLIHVDGHMVQGGRVDLFQAASGKVAPLLSDPGFFQAPAWSVDGTHVLYVAQPAITSATPSMEDVQSNIVRVAADGSGPQILASEKGADLRMVRSPRSDQVAYVALRSDGQGSMGWGGLQLVDGNGGAARTLSQQGEHVESFFWSPDGSKIAYLSYQGAFSPGGAMAWHVVDVQGGNVQSFEAFEPSEAFAQLQLFFDAYTSGLSPWSADGQRLAYGAKDGGVYVASLANGKAERVADGTLGVWVGGK